jgi:hypothetical protein
MTMTPEEQEFEEIEEEVESRVQSILSEENEDPFSDSDHAMYLREDIRQQVLQERRDARLALQPTK